MPEQKTNIPLALLAIAVLIGGFYLGGNQVPPGPGPTPGPDIIGIAKIAADDGATYLAALGANCEQIADRIDSAELKTTDAVNKELLRLNDVARHDAFTPWHAAINPAVQKQDLKELSALLRESAKGFPAAVKE